jgi:hypothetical protein
MNHELREREILASYLLAAVTIVLGFFLYLRLGSAAGPAGSIILRGSYFVALGIVFHGTVVWGHRRGYYLQREDGRINYTHLLRVLVMTGIVWLGVCFCSGPVLMAVFQFSR